MGWLQEGRVSLAVDIADPVLHLCPLTCHNPSARSPSTSPASTPSQKDWHSSPLLAKFSMPSNNQSLQLPVRSRPAAPILHSGQAEPPPSCHAPHQRPKPPIRQCRPGERETNIGASSCPRIIPPLAPSSASGKTRQTRLSFSQESGSLWTVGVMDEGTPSAVFMYVQVTDMADGRKAAVLGSTRSARRPMLCSRPCWQKKRRPA